MEMNKMTKRWSWPLACVLLLGFGLLMAGCESDPVAPQEEPPALTEKEAAQQAALVAVGVAEIGPEILKAPALKDLGIYPYDFPADGIVLGSVIMEFFTGGAGGTHSHWNDADYGLLYTPDKEVLEVEFMLPIGEGVTVGFALDFSLFGPIDREEDEAVVSGTGNYITGAGTAPFTLTSVVVSGIYAYPTDGTLLFETGGWEVLVTYDGTDTALVAVNGVDMFTVNLDTGWLTPITES